MMTNLGYSSPTSAPNWKPPLFHPLYILTLVLLHIFQIVGIQLLVNKYDNDLPEINLIRQNATLRNNPQSIFAFDESSVTEFLMWQYLPVAIATILAIIWESLDVTVRRLEPFHQLSRSEGGTSSNAMCLDYVTRSIVLVLFSAVRKRHYTVAVSATLYIVSAIVIPTLTGGMWTIEWGSLLYSSQPTEGANFATISMNRSIIIATQVVHGLVAMSGVALSWILFHRPTGLYHDPRGIGGVASLVSDADHSGSNLLSLFRQLPSFAHSNVLLRSLREITFSLRHRHVTLPDGSVRTTYQLLTNAHPDHSFSLHHNDLLLWHDRRDASGWWLSKRVVVGAEIFLWLGQAAIIGAIYKAAKFLGPDSAADSMKPTISKMVCILCTAVGGFMWQAIQREVQVFEPWLQLARSSRGRDSPSSSSSSCSSFQVLVQRDIVSLGLVGGMIISLAKGWLVSLWAGFATIMVHTATVFIPPLTELVYAAGMIDTSPYEVRRLGVLSGKSGLALGATGFGIHLVILGNMCFLLLSGRTRAFMPRRPTTIASQIMYLCHSERLLAEFRGTSTLSGRELEQKLGVSCQEYRFGWFWSWQRQASFVGVEVKATPEIAGERFEFGKGLDGASRCI
ncbi:hypothetical protein BJX63DRAFT_434602 [Aspergillus granulosus]|uniref:Uncharacterized protein n=1 Tax=Aspergillus granulosus TaxID=176169 RepID=A0ABR4H3R7_9EURO